MDIVQGACSAQSRDYGRSSALVTMDGANDEDLGGTGEIATLDNSNGVSVYRTSYFELSRLARSRRDETPQ